MKISFLFAFFVSFGVIIFGKVGLVSAYKKSQELSHLNTRISRIEKKNTVLREKIQNIKNPESLEYVIRKRLPLVKEDELLFEFK